jgi:hypothetical protein
MRHRAFATAIRRRRTGDRWPLALHQIRDSRCLPPDCRVCADKEHCAPGLGLIMNKRFLAILVAATALAGCGPAAASGPTSQSAGPAGQSVSSPAGQAGTGIFVSTTGHPPFDSNMTFTCTPTGITGGNLDYALTINPGNISGQIPVDVRSIAVFLSENGFQQPNADYPSFSQFTLYPGKPVTLRLSSPLGTTPDASDTWQCGLSGVNVTE